jgi:hypothetical protein
MGALLAYAGWNIHREFSLTAAPTPISVGAFTAGLLGLLFAGWVTLAAWRAARTARPEPASKPEPEPASEPELESEPTSAPAPDPVASVPALTDGSGDTEVDDGPGTPTRNSGTRTSARTRPPSDTPWERRRGALLPRLPFERSKQK